MERSALNRAEALQTIFRMRRETERPATSIRRSAHDPQGREVLASCCNLPSWATRRAEDVSPPKAAPPQPKREAKMSQPPLKMSLDDLPYDILIIISMLLLQAWCEAPRFAEVNSAMKHAMGRCTCLPRPRDPVA